MAFQESELFDIASKGSNACWSLNPWKTRLVLNFKSLPYKTTFLEYPDIAPTLKNLGIPPNPSSSELPPYTIPAIRLPNGNPLMDSRAIATELDRLHPSPSLHLDSPILPKVEALIPRAIRNPLLGLLMPRVPRNLLNGPSAEYFETTRAQRFGCSLSELEAKTSEEEAWKEAAPALREMAALLEEGKRGPFYMGETVSYADFVAVGALEFVRRVDGSLFERIVGMEPALGRLWEACGGWLERDGH